MADSDKDLIDVFLTRSSAAIEELVNRSKLQIEEGVEVD